MKQAYVTVISTDDYLPGVLALAKNVSETCKHPLVVMASRSLGEGTYAELNRRNIPYVQVDDVDPPYELMQATLEDAWFSHWAKSFLKLRIFDLVEFDKIVFIDCDMMLMDSVDEVFGLPDMSATVGGKSFPGHGHLVDLNSGLMVIVPSEGLSESIIATIPEVAANKGVFGDQDVMQAYFSDWKQKKELLLPGGYNVWFSHYQFYLENEFVKVVHFIGKKKPWMMNTYDILREYIKCLVKGNAKGIAVLRRYRKLLKEASCE